MSKPSRPNFERDIILEGSDIISSVKYDPHTSILDVTLLDGKRYRYDGVYPSAFASLVTSKSAGKVYNETIKPFAESVRKLPKKRPNPTGKLDKPTKNR